MRNKFIGMLLLALSACQSNITIPASIPGFKQAVALETYATEKYTYMLGFAEGREIWLACPITEIIIGQTYFYKDELVMNQFRSKETGKVFDQILFVQELSPDPLVPKIETEFHHPTIDPTTQTQIQTQTPSSSANQQSGIAIETMNAAKYTYMLAKVEGAVLWFAFPITPIIVGKRYAFTDPMLMTGFQSHELKRKFDTIYFLSGVQEISESSTETVKAKQSNEVQPISNVNGKVIAIATLMAQPSKYAGKEVTILGKVVKYNPEIMGRNWIHLSDGSKGNFGTDITVTTTEAAVLGKIYLCKGKVVLNKDFGAGYKYDILLGEAVLQPQ